MSTPEKWEEEFDYQFNGWKMLSDSRPEIKDFIRKLLVEEREKLKEEILPKVQKFIDKVDTGGARSVETYKDMQEIKKLLLN